jgi:hypothetical protein
MSAVSLVNPVVSHPERNMRRNAQHVVTCQRSELCGKDIRTHAHLVSRQRFGTDEQAGETLGCA